MQQKDAIHSAGNSRADFVVLTGGRKHHVQEIFRIAQIITWVDERLPLCVFVTHGGQGWHFRNQPVGSDLAVFGVIDVSRVMVERRQRTDYAAKNRHRVSVWAKPFEKTTQLLIHHGVVLDGVDKRVAFRSVWQFTVEQQVTQL